MKRNITSFLFMAVILLSAQFLNAQITIPVGASSTYHTIQSAYDFGIPGTISNAYKIELQSDYNSAIEIYPISLTGKTGASASNTITITSAAGLFVHITSSATSTFYLNGAKHVIITGNSSWQLDIKNTNVSGNAIVFINDAAYNTLNYCIIRGINNGQNVSSTGVVLFSTTTGIIGNSYDTVINCIIDGMSQASSLIYSYGTFTPATVENSHNTIIYCNLRDNFRDLPTTNNVAIWLYQGNTFWTIYGNYIYQLSPRTYANSNLHMGIVLSSNWTSDAHLVTNNFIGGTGNPPPGIILNTSGANIIGYEGIFASDIGGVGMEISGNQIENIQITCNGLGSFTNAGIYAYMRHNGEQIKISNNIIFNATVTNTGGFALWSGIFLQSDQSGSSPIATTANIDSNIIGVAYTLGAGTAGSAIYGINLVSSSAPSTTAPVTITTNIRSNSIGSLYANGTTLFMPSFATGIRASPNPGAGSDAKLVTSPTITGNYISNIFTNSNSVNPAGSASGMYINLTNGTDVPSKAIIKSNTINTIGNTNTTEVGVSAAGISLLRGAFDVSKNHIYDIRDSSLGIGTPPNVSGIIAQTLLPINPPAFFNLGQLTNQPIQMRNTDIRKIIKLIPGEIVNDNILPVSSPISLSPDAIFQDTTNIYNNYITLGDAQTSNTQFFGIWEQVSALSTYLGVFDNTVLITGDANSHTKTTAAILRGTEFLAGVTTPMIVKNNLLINNRHNGGSHYAIYSPSNVSFASNYNTYVTPDASKMGFWMAAPVTFAIWKGLTAGDNNSYYFLLAPSTDFTSNPATLLINDLFSNASFSSNDTLDIDSTKSACWSVNGKGTQINDQVVISDDIYTHIRSTTFAGGPTDIGAYEFSTSTIPPVVYQSGTPVPTAITSYNQAGFDLLDITWGASFDRAKLKSGGEVNTSPMTLPSSVSVQKYSGVTVPDTNRIVGVGGILMRASMPLAKTGFGYIKITTVGGDPASPVDFTYHYGTEELGLVIPETDLILAMYDINNKVWVPFPQGAGTGQSDLNTFTKTITVRQLPRVNNIIFMLCNKLNPLVRLGLDLTLLIQGRYNNYVVNPPNYALVPDTVWAILYQQIGVLYTRTNEMKVVLNTTGQGFGLSGKWNTDPLPSTGTNYWLTIRHKNSIATWSNLGDKQFSAVTGVMKFDFTSALTQAYGANMTIINGKSCIYTGDVNQDGAVDALDMIAIDNDVSNFVTGIVVTDLNGDQSVDALDMILCDNNVSGFVTAVKPPGAPVVKFVRTKEQMQTIDRYKKRIEESKKENMNKAKKSISK